MDNVKRQIGYACPDTINGRITGRGVRAAILDTGAYPHPDMQICSMDDADFMMTAGTEHMWQEFLPETGKCPVEGMQGWHREWNF